MAERPQLIGNPEHILKESKLRCDGKRIKVKIKTEKSNSQRDNMSVILSLIVEEFTLG